MPTQRPAGNDQDLRPQAPDPKQHPRTGHVAVALIISIGLWAYMVFGPLAYLSRIAGGLEPFDMRPFGYDLAEARAFLAAISTIGRDYYANVQLPFDTAYPAIYAFSRGLLLWWLFVPGRIANRPLPLFARASLIALPFAAAGFDYLENAGIAAMLAAGPRVTADLVDQTSFWTQAKSIASGATEATAVILLAIALIRSWHRRQARKA